MKKVHLLPSTITAFGLSCGLFAIFKINMTDSSDIDYHVLAVTAGLILLAGFADLLDGAVARAMKAESSFGGIFDALADAITFGVAPSLIVMKSLSLKNSNELFFLMTMAAMVYTVCGVLRLVRFCVKSQSETDITEILESKKNFTGLPIPAAAAAAISLNLLMISEEFKSLINLDAETRSWLMFFLLIILGYLMISRWKFPSLKTLQIRVSSFQLVFATVLTAVIIFYGVFNHFAIVFAAISWLYVFIALILSVIRLTTGRKSKTLEDFDPEPEDDHESI